MIANAHAPYARTELDDNPCALMAKDTWHRVPLPESAACNRQVRVAHPTGTKRYSHLAGTGIVYGKVGNLEGSPSFTEDGGFHVASPNDLIRLKCDLTAGRKPRSAARFMHYASTRLH